MPPEELVLTERPRHPQSPTVDHKTRAECDTPTGKPNFSNIAQEIFDLIMNKVNLEDLRNLRLVSTGINAKTLDIFTKEHFTDYSLLLCSRESLQNACEVARHPVFGRVIEKVTVFVDKLRIGARMPDYEGGVFYKECNSKYDMLRVGEIAKECLETVNELYDALTDQHELRTSGQDRKLLTNIFTFLNDNARIRGVNIDVCSNSGWHWSRNLRIFQKFKRHNVRFTDPLVKVRLGFESPDFEYEDGIRTDCKESHFPFSLVMQALLQSDLRPKDLASAANMTRWTLDIGKVLQDTDTLIACQTVFTDLEHLSVGISHTADSWRNFEVVDADIESFGGLLASASNLVSLTLGTGHCSRLYNAVAKAVFPSLCDLKLCKISIPLADLHTIVKGLVERNPSLQRLHLQDLYLLHCKGFMSEEDIVGKRGAGTIDDFKTGCSEATETNLLGNALQKLFDLPGDYRDITLFFPDGNSAEDGMSEHSD